MKKYLYIYMEFVKTSFVQQLEFRVNFVLMILLDLALFFSTIFSIDFIFDTISFLGSWNKNQFLFFSSFVLALNSLHMSFLASNFWIFSQDLKMGLIDFVILKPANIIFQIFFRFIRISNLLTFIFISAYMIHYGILIKLSFLSWILLPIFLILGFILTFNLEVIISTMMFWIIEGNGINFLRMQIKDISNWPYFIYSQTIKIIFLVIFPILLVASAPAEFLINGRLYLLIGMLVAIIVSSFIMQYFFSYGLKKYESASS